MNHFFDVLKLGIGIFISVLYNFFFWKYDDIWLIGERKTEAKDNGYHLFKYIRTKHPEKKIYYVIDWNASQKARVEKYGQTIDHNSLKHYIMFCRANKLILPFEKSTFPESKIIWYFYRLKFLRKKVAFIQHGITKEKQVHYSYDNRFKFDLFVCAAEVECEFVKKEMNYPASVAINLGFSRYDNLIDTQKSNQIFFMPTWRAWMHNYTEQEFLDSVYYKNISCFLKSNQLAEILIDNECSIILYLHDAFQNKFRHLFESSNPNVIIADNESYDVQVLLKESKVLITDFSSIAFDFAYMQKPLLYYQFDADEYYAKHFIKGYFDCSDDGFGDVCNDTKSLLDKLTNIFSNNYGHTIYHQRSMDFFGRKDQKNSFRIYNAIEKL